MSLEMNYVPWPSILVTQKMNASRRWTQTIWINNVRTLNNLYKDYGLTLLHNSTWWIRDLLDSTYTEVQVSTSFFTLNEKGDLIIYYFYKKFDTWIIWV